MVLRVGRSRLCRRKVVKVGRSRKRKVVKLWLVGQALGVSPSKWHFQGGDFTWPWPHRFRVWGGGSRPGLWFGAPRAPRYSALRDAVRDKPGGCAIGVVI